MLFCQICRCKAEEVFGDLELVKNLTAFASWWWKGAVASFMMNGFSSGSAGLKGDVVTSSTTSGFCKDSGLRPSHYLLYQKLHIPVISVTGVRVTLLSFLYSVQDN
ncbi:hypothetical protein CEXT_634991 [Caerostris extrusa]|uniref:Uncharacterized protein n=1 Tax=Caerostris extrusa TaxID=172846 RepID=A0AAV4W145_CAEEX|nr:hypothetical protein CEXT_634991 [Caerostris extrusa]